jgi:LPS export ABC transporter protein LptC
MEKIKQKLKNIYEKFMSLDKRKRSYIIAISVFVFVMAWAFISAGVITSNFNRSQIKGKEDEQKVDAIGVIITETKEGKKYFEIYGETGHYSNDHSIATLYNVIGNFYSDGEVAMSFQSSKGTYDENTGVITLYENTYIVLKDGVSLKTNKLVWSGSDKETIVEGNVVIKKSNDMVSTAERGVIGANYEHFKIIGKTKTQIFGKDKEN